MFNSILSKYVYFFVLKLQYRSYQREHFFHIGFVGPLEGVLSTEVLPVVDIHASLYRYDVYLNELAKR